VGEMYESIMPVYQISDTFDGALLGCMSGILEMGCHKRNHRS